MKITTTEDLLNDRTLFSEADVEEIRVNTKNEVAKIKAGRPSKIANNPRNKNVKVSDNVKIAIQYAYKEGIIISIEDIDLLKYVREKGITLSQLKKA